MRWLMVMAVVVALGIAGSESRAHEVARAAAPAHAADDLKVARGMRYRVPDVRVIDARGRSASLASSLDGPEPLLLNFVFTTCSTICSTQTAILAEVQRRLRAEGRRARFVSITIDPANDTPARLAAFARQFDIERDWTFLTGDFDDLLGVQQAFDVYRGAKAAHPPVVLLRPGRNTAWVRLEGIAAASDILALFAAPAGGP